MKKRMFALLMAFVMLLTIGSTGLTAFADGGDTGGTGIYSEGTAFDAADFLEPDFEYRPGVRWWWPGNAASTEDLKKQVDYLVDNGFGVVEIVGFTGSSFLAKTGTYGENARQPYYAIDEYDDATLDAVFGWDTPAFYAKLKTVVEYCNEKGIVVDLNMGSGYDANDTGLKLEESAASMALGRSTLDSLTAGTAVTDITVPAVEAGMIFGTEAQGGVMGDWDADLAHLNAVIVAEIISTTGNATLTGRNQVLDFTDHSAPVVAKTYTNQYKLNLADAQVFEAADIVDGKIPSFTPGSSASYEVIAVYSVPGGSTGIQSFWRNEETGKRNYVVDHMSADMTKRYVDVWLNENAGMKAIVEDPDINIRGAFNDSYEFWIDTYFNDNLYKIAKEAAEPDGLLGYDITRFMPAQYKQFGQVAPYGSTFVAGYPSLEGTLNTGGSSVNYFITGQASAENTRITYDYNQLVSQAFMEGMAGFTEGLSEYNGGILYRQQAYNPPIDTIKASKYIGIPEAEQENENNLRRASSGAHLYGKNLVTAEQYTLGNTTFNVTPQKIKLGYDLMAVSGVNNFFYHGLSATYKGHGDEMETGLFPEEGWRAWTTIGVEMAETEAMSPYYKTMNEYASRANYAMQIGKPSSDVAVYMPLFGSLPAATTSLVTTLNRNGLTYDMINNDCITDELTWSGGKLSTDAGMTYNALVVYTQTLPVKTMEALLTLTEAGAPIIFYGSLPNQQPSYAGGNYAAEDAKVSTLADEIVAAGGKHIATQAANNTVSDDLTDELFNVCDPAISFDQVGNSDLRLNRRTLPNGGELAYIRNANVSTDYTFTVNVDQSLSMAYWLDQSTGKIFNADVTDDNVTITLNRAGAVILMCVPNTSALDAASVSGGLPESIRQIPADAKSVALSDFTLTVTADNFNESGSVDTSGSNAGVVPIATSTKTFNENVLGNWTANGFQDNLLRFVSSPGVYETTFNVLYETSSIVLDLGAVNYSATVYVNEEEIGQIFSAPYQIDLTGKVKKGENALKVEVQPLKGNRRAGLRLAYNADKIANKKYMAYQSHTSNANLTAAGMAGPVTLYVTEPRELGKVLEILNELLNEIDAANYTEESMAALENAVEAAKIVASNPNSTDAQINSALKDVIKAIASLNPIDVPNKSILEKLLDSLASLNPDNYDETGWNSLQDAIDAAQNVLNNASATQKQINDAAKTVLDAVNGLNLVDPEAVNVGALNSAIAWANGLNQDKYTGASWALLQSALTAAQAIDADVATQAEVATAITNLQNAIKELVAKPAAAVVNKSDLRNVVSIAENITKGNYTDASWNALQSAIAAANDVLNNAGATQAQVDNAFDNITLANSGLTTNPVTPVIPGTTSGSGSGGGSSKVDGAPAGGSSVTAAAPVQTLRPLEKTEAVPGAKKAIEATAAARFKNISTIALDVNKAMAAEKLDKVYIDSMTPDGAKVEVRVTYDPAKATIDINAHGRTTSDTAKARKTLFEKWFSNKFFVVSLDQKGSFGMTVEVAAKADFTGMDTKNLKFYSYDAATNKYTEIKNPSYWFDANGYIHFNTDMGGDIIISDGALAKK